jgi:enamine deaminase RidA (YjgF/YER057c/UK114 family)
VRRSTSKRGRRVPANAYSTCKLTVFVASAPGFTAQPSVADGASRLLLEVLGDAGRHTRSAVGVAELPLGSPVEIEAIVQLSS